MSIPNNLKQCRLACGLTQVQVADRLGLNCHDRLSKWEHGIMFPHVVNLLKLSVIYDKRPDELYPGLLSSIRQELEPSPSSIPSSSPQDTYQVPL